MTADVDKLADEIAHRIEVGTGASYHHSLRTLARAAAKTAWKEGFEASRDLAVDDVAYNPYTTEEPS